MEKLDALEVAKELTWQLDRLAYEADQLRTLVDAHERSVDAVRSWSLLLADQIVLDRLGEAVDRA